MSEWRILSSFFWRQHQNVWRAVSQKEAMQSLPSTFFMSLRLCDWKEGGSKHLSQAVLALRFCKCLKGGHCYSHLSYPFHPEGAEDFNLVFLQRELLHRDIKQMSLNHKKETSYASCILKIGYETYLTYTYLEGKC